MSAKFSTSTYDLPLFDRNDKPGWLTDWNATMVKLDNAIKSAAEGVTPGTFQDTLVSGVNIKTINGESVLGAGNLEITGSGSGLPADQATKVANLPTAVVTGASNTEITEDQVTLNLDTKDLASGGLSVQSLELPMASATFKNSNNQTEMGSAGLITGHQAGVIKNVDEGFLASFDDTVADSTTLSIIANYKAGHDSSAGHDSITLPAATVSEAGIMTAAQASKLNNVSETIIESLTPNPIQDVDKVQIAYTAKNTSTGAESYPFITINPVTSTQSGVMTPEMLTKLNAGGGGSVNTQTFVNQRNSSSLTVAAGDTNSISSFIELPNFTSGICLAGGAVTIQIPAQTTASTFTFRIKQQTRIITQQLYPVAVNQQQTTTILPFFVAIDTNSRTPLSLEIVNGNIDDDVTFDLLLFNWYAALIS